MFVLAPIERGALARLGLAGFFYRCTHAQVARLHADHTFRLQSQQRGAQAGGQCQVAFLLQRAIVHRDPALPELFGKVPHGRQEQRCARFV